jgi:2-phospho-L-lactate/phosphoenolpyruvate guanylyltransferase
VSWTAIVPINLGRERKSRLAERLSAIERAVLADAMSDHVLECLRASAEISRIIVLAPQEPTQAGIEWRRDLGRGLNAELGALREGISGHLLVIHGDLPLLGVDDVRALLAAAQAAGVALAPDRHGLGTNAVALMAGEDFVFAFGEGSLARHALTLGAAMVSRTGLACDVDTPADLDAVLAMGWRCKN